MTPISTAADLRQRIISLEAICLQQEEDIKYTAAAALDSIKPSTLLKNTFNNTVRTPGFGKALLKGAAGIAVGFLTKKLFVRSSSGIVKKALGMVLELGIAKAVSNNADKIAGSGRKLLNRVVK